ncbi:GAK system CofD-like protein [Desulfoplanes sp.]
MRIRLTRDVTIPSPIALERFRHYPALGPRVLFFSGGSALREVSRALTKYTHNSIHIITPFDSGGSSATIRRAFDMLAVGDVRNRLMALADTSIQGNPEIFELFAHRLSQEADQGKLRATLSQMSGGEHPMIRAIPDPMRKIIRTHIHQFEDLMPDSFDLRGASMGNLVLTAGYLTNRRHLDPVIYIFSKLVRVLGKVRPVTSTNAELAVRLEDDRKIVCQHRFTGKETRPISSPIKDIWLVTPEDDTTPFRPAIRTKITACIEEAELICYPIGSFYSSLIANLLPAGVGKTVAANTCPKVYVPNPCPDLEALGLDITEQIQRLLHYARQDDPEHIAPSDVLDFVIIDSQNGTYTGLPDRDILARQGIGIIDTPLLRAANANHVDPDLFTGALLSLC